MHSVCDRSAFYVHYIRERFAYYLHLSAINLHGCALYVQPTLRCVHSICEKIALHLPIALHFLCICFCTLHANDHREFALHLQRGYSCEKISFVKPGNHALRRSKNSNPALSFLSLNMNNSSSETTDRIRKRDQLRSFLSSRTKELYNYYNTPSPSRSISTPSLERTDTQEMDDIIQIPEIVQPQCIVFPTYGCHCAGDKYKIILAGWAFAKPASTRLDRFLQSNAHDYNIPLLTLV